MKLSLCLAVFNEGKNIAACLESAKDIAGEIIVIDGGSNDKTAQIAKKYGAKVIITNNPPIFHLNKQKAIGLAKGEWILQLDADERLTKELRKEIVKMINMTQEEIKQHQENLPEKNLFLRHQKIVKPNDVNLDQDIVAFFIPRLNFFLGKFLRFGGLYPDGVIRLFKKGQAFLPCQDIHELMTVKGKIGWIKNPLLHYDSPTFERYLNRNNRYINFMVKEMKDKKLPKNFLYCLDHLLIKPIIWFFSTLIRHKGILHGWQGIIFCFFSAIRFPIAYVRYLLQSKFEST